jgi:hypothetical protein
MEAIMAPRLPKGGRRAATPDPQPPPAAGDNARAIEEGERVQLISFVSKLTDADAAVEAAKAPFDAAKKKRTGIFNLAKAAGFSRERLERYLKLMGESTREVADNMAVEAKHFRWLGIINEDQAKLFLGDETPTEVKDEAHWKAEGYKAGLRQMLAKPPPECGERFVQPWMHEHARGLREVLEANAPKPLGGVREQAAKDFAADEPEVDVDAAARKLKNDPQFMARGAAEPETSFEATEEELAAQKARTAVQDGREGRTSGEAADVV